MDIWLELIRENNLYKDAYPASMDEIETAEKELGLSFALDYRAFLSGVGASICLGHEIKGITDNANLNVISATKEVRERFDLVPHSWYVVEDTHMDSIVILQDKNGSVYQMAPGTSAQKIAYNLESYLSETMTGIKNRTMTGAEKIDQTGITRDLDEKAQEVLSHHADEAKEILNDPDRVEKYLQALEKKLEKIPGVGDWLADVPAVISLIRSYIRKEYKSVPVSSIIAGLAAVIYVVSPVDLIPDAIPGLGMLDDAAVFVVCWKMIHDDVDKYQAWRKQHGKDIKGND